MKLEEPNFAKLIEYKRNGLTEQMHSGLIILMNKSGVIKKIGEDNNYPFYMRSCMKPLQASILIDLELDKKYNLTEREIAVCCASHTGEKIHQELIKSVLKKIGLSENELLCPAHEPLSKKENEYLILNGLKPQKIHNNCSGKHSAMLAACMALGLPIDNYRDLTHPLSEIIIRHVCSLCGILYTPHPGSQGEREKKTCGLCGINGPVISKDGCGLPVIAAPLEAMGCGFLNVFTNPKYKKITGAFLNNPYLIGGEGRLDTQIIENSKNITAKTGAGGLCIIVNLEKEEALIIKIADCNMEARSAAAFEALKQLKWTDEKSVRMKNLNNRGVKTLDGENIGSIETCFSLV